MDRYMTLRTEKDYLKRLLSHAMTRLSDSIEQLSFGWLMYDITKSASMTAFILFVNFLPNVFLQPFLGVLVERFDKKKVIVYCDLARAILIFLLVFIYVFYDLNASLLLLFAFLVSVIESLNGPASTALYPMLLEKDKYNLGIALSNSLIKIVELVGVGIAGIMIKNFGVTGAFLLDGLGFCISMLMTITIHTNEHLEKKKLTLKRYNKEFKEGIETLKQLQHLHIFIMLGMFINFALSPLNAFQSAYVVESLHFGAGMLSMIGITMTLGISLGALFSPKIQRSYTVQRVTLLSGLFQALGMFGYWLSPMISHPILRGILIIIMTFIFGFSFGLYVVIINTRMVAGIPQHFLSRIMSVSAALTSLCVPIGALICSGLALIIPVPIIYLLFSVLMAVIYVVASKNKNLEIEEEIS